MSKLHSKLKWTTIIDRVNKQASDRYSIIDDGVYKYSNSILNWQPYQHCMHDTEHERSAKEMFIDDLIARRLFK